MTARLIHLSSDMSYLHAVCGFSRKSVSDHSRGRGRISVHHQLVTCPTCQRALPASPTLPF